MKKPYTIAPADRLGLSKEEAAEYVGMSTTLFDELVEEGLMPAPKKAHSRLIWSRKTLEKAFDALPEKGQATPNPAAPWTELQV